MKKILILLLFPAIANAEWLVVVHPKVHLDGETIERTIDGYASNTFVRYPVPGGWLVEGGRELTFLPDPKHEWK